MSRRSDDRLAARAADLARIAASEEPKLCLRPVEAANSEKTTTARFLAVGGAHVIVERIITDGSERFTAACEACGDFDRSRYYNQESAEDVAIEHAETCRRIPERLWPKDGAR